MLIVEIILTIFAWRKGWKWYSLLPTGAALLIAFLFGTGIGASGGNVEAVTGFGVVLDVMVIIALIILNVKGPKSTEVIDTPVDTKEKINDEFKSL